MIFRHHNNTWRSRKSRLNRGACVRAIGWISQWSERVKRSFIHGVSRRSAWFIQQDHQEWISSKHDDENHDDGTIREHAFRRRVARRDFFARIVTRTLCGISSRKSARELKTICTADTEWHPGGEHAASFVTDTSERADRRQWGPARSAGRARPGPRCAKREVAFFAPLQCRRLFLPLSFKRMATLTRQVNTLGNSTRMIKLRFLLSRKWSRHSCACHALARALILHRVARLIDLGYTDSWLINKIIPFYPYPICFHCYQSFHFWEIQNKRWIARVTISTRANSLIDWDAMKSSMQYYFWKRQGNNNI